MPSRDSTGKRLSGAQLRQRKAQREAPDPPASKKRKAKKPTAAEAEPDLDSAPNPFNSLGAPPIDDTAQLVRWSAKLHALAVAHIAQHPGIYPNQREWLRALLGGTTQLGILRDKAAEQQKIEEALRREEQEGKRQGLVSVGGRKAAAATRPPS